MNPLVATQVPLAGCNLIEASAGCGKTHSITTLFVRLVVEQGLAVGEILVVTYTRSATAELRDRIRRRLRSALDCVSAVAAAADRDPELSEYFVGRGAEHALDERRLQAALRDFDQAAILTIHAFCQRVLSDHAFESGSPFEVRFVEDILPLVDDVGRDFWAQRFYTASVPDVEAALAKSSGAKPGDLLQLGRRVHGITDLRVLPELPVPVDREQALVTAWRAARDEAAAAWERDAESLTRFLAAGYFTKISYKPGSVAGWCAQMQRLRTFEPPNLPKCAERFASSALMGGLLKEHRALKVDQLCFAACERWLQAHEQLTSFMKQRTLATRLEFVSYVRREVAARKHRQGLMGFDDLLSSLDSALAGPAGQALADGVRERYRAALIDEFQDTDPVQYAIFRALFRHGELPLFLIGDPKQAIYAFRGADVFAYMEAARHTARAVWGLTRNYRSDPGLIAVLQQVFTRLPDPFLHPGINFARVEPRPEARNALERGGAVLPPFEVLLADTGADDATLSKGRAERALCAPVAAEIRALIASGATLRTDGPGQAPEPVQARHVAVLCRTNKQAASMQDALRAVGIASVLEGDSSVFDTLLCEELERVLRAAAQPGDAGKIRAALLTSIFAVEIGAVREMHAGQDADWDGWVASFGEWNRLWRERGFIQAFHRMLDERRVQQTLLARPDGQRQLTNLLHLGELLHEAATSGHLGPLSLLHWLSQMRLDEEWRGGLTGESEQLRLESDEHAVRLTTIHKSKGLEYPIVYCPFLWTGPFNIQKRYSVFHDAALPDARLSLDLGSDAYDQHEQWQEAEELTESMRLLYVALTRARHRCTVVWGKFSGSEKSPLAHLLHASADTALAERFDGDAVNARCAGTASRIKKLAASARRAEVQALARQMPGLELRDLASSEAPVEPPPPDAAALAAAAQLRARPFDRELPRHHRISSFSALTARAGHALSALADEGLDRDEGQGSEPEERLEEGDAAAAPASAARSTRLVRLHDFPRGARAGNLIHHVYEHLDFRASAVDIRTQVAASLLRFGYTGAQGETLAASLAAAIAENLGTPLSEAEPTLRLDRVARADRLDELEFVLPVAESSTSRMLTAATLATAFETHDAPAASPGYARRVRKLPFRALTGYLKGYIDLVFRHGGRYFIVDYKSNYLGDQAGDYAPERLAAAMEESHYYLQYHLYAVALHRHLAQRLGPRYDYARDFGGVFYLFVRGLSPEHPPGSGVFADRPSLALLQALSSAVSSPGALP